MNERIYLAHHGIKGQKWYVRRYQNEDGTLTYAGRKRYLTFNKELNSTKLRKDLIKSLNKADKERSSYDVKKQATMQSSINGHYNTTKILKLNEKIEKYSDDILKLLDLADASNIKINSMEVDRFKRTGMDFMSSAVTLGTQTLPLAAINVSKTKHSAKGHVFY